ncbi:MAG: M20/M25/M40 family metallo-hydrolase [Deltaproteobacteria bacterium]|nr:M20/M25/M40 family metallo-hydrolase [Deltaproteobacteria bacterium]
MIDKTRLTERVLELVRIDSLSRREGAIAARLRELLESLGATVFMDDAGSAVGGEVGNLVAHFDGATAGAEPMLLSAHMDTVAPGEGVVPVVEGDVIRSDGRTVLGGDDKSGIAIILEVIEALAEDGVAHGDIDVVFTICEEVGLLGAKHLDLGLVRAKTGLVLDSDSIGFLITKAPAVNHLEFEVHGLEAHAGICPERGISAIQVAAQGIAAMPLGRIDDETTANLGLVSGGTAVNIVPNRVVLTGEVRSHDEEKLERQTQTMQECLRQAAAGAAVELDGRVHEARVEARIVREYDRMDVPHDTAIVRRVHEAARNLGFAVDTVAKGGGCDANVLNKRGLQVANLASGMRDIHTVHEWLDVNDLVSAARIIHEVLRLEGDHAR